MHSIQSFQDGIIAGDCVRVMLDMPTESVDLVVTDPPYLARLPLSRDGRQGGQLRPSGWAARGCPRRSSRLSLVLKPDRFCVSFYGLALRPTGFSRAWRSGGAAPSFP